MTRIYENDLERVKKSQLNKYLGQRSFLSKLIIRKQRQTDTLIQQSYSCTQTTKMVGNKKLVEQ